MRPTFFGRARGPPRGGSENTAMFQPQAAIACSADQDCGAASANLLRSKATNADPWVIGLRQQRPSLVVAVALANKTARIAWAVMHRHENYQRVAAAAYAADPRSGACEIAMTRDGTVGRSAASE